MKFLTTMMIFLCLFLACKSEGRAALCAFRNPDRETYILFPEATGYKTVFKMLNPTVKKALEEFLGQPLDYDEGGAHTFYLVLKGEKVIGIIRPHAERGRYGIVEMVWAFTLDGKIKDFIIQRSREKGTEQLKSDAFRRQFKGKTLQDHFTLPGTKRIDHNFFKPVATAVSSSSIVAYSAKKNLFLYCYLFHEYCSPAGQNSDDQR